MTIIWKKDLPLPMARPRYYDYEYLRADDLTQALDYLLARQNLAARLLRPMGVVSGLELTATGSDVTVGQGVAIDGDGIVIVLPESRRTALPGDGTFFVWVEYHEFLSDPRDEGGVAAETRWTEEGLVKVSATAPPDAAHAVLLGKVTRTGGTVTVQGTGRQVAGLRVPVGAIVPAVGGGSQAGITFPTDPGGGSGDEAFIRYWPYSGENTILRIANNNDPDDLIAFTQYGADRLRIGGGMLHLGSMEGTLVSAGQVVTALGFWGPGVQHAQLSFRAGKGFELVDRSADGPNLSYAEGSKPYADLGVRELRASSLRGRGGLSLTAEGNFAVRASGGVTVVKDGSGNGDLTVQGNAWVNGNLTLPNWSWINGGTRLHIGGPERLYLLNAAGVHIGFGGVAGNDSGCLFVQNRSSFGGDMTVTGKLMVGPATPPLASWSGGGISTWDLFASGAIYLGLSESSGYTISLNAGSGVIKGKSKQFAIDHPLDPPDATQRRQLIHAAIEGPENGVYYRGEGRLSGGVATVELPAYFEALTRPEDRTVQLTPVFDDDEPVSPLAAGRVRDGAFRVHTVDGSPASHAFYWEVKAVRADLEPLAVEVPA
ncbi:hypothetical protein ONA91_19985 [Micromonospora sp. DR5-3]|uniref:hypothetical protein n=1 Tax=unclassified Micromonospora TaxID=2617518 RepID=UPI0011D6BECB|nr:MULTISPECIES: hypothetical protein [unclassified Micromonospora]MCW3816730.1 hypothetical protein [Micromonospora sp. DR5-3]TYC20690.1 hypothetical protein FXF52_30020 [Micromonospora sp. MP36]